MPIKQRSAMNRAEVLNRMLDQLERLGFPMKGPRSALNAGEDGICFMKIFYVAKLNAEFCRDWAAELLEFNEFYSNDPYMRHCGYPLS
jgi:hypothetical protein